jgi:hypothetical protein
LDKEYFAIAESGHAPSAVRRENDFETRQWSKDKPNHLPDTRSSTSEAATRANTLADKTNPEPAVAEAADAAASMSLLALFHPSDA